MTNIEKDISERKLTFGEKAVGLTFNPSNNEGIDIIKKGYAQDIDYLNDLRNSVSDGEQKRLLSIAITETQSAQMWAIKAFTWNMN